MSIIDKMKIVRGIVMRYCSGRRATEREREMEREIGHEDWISKLDSTTG